MNRRSAFLFLWAILFLFAPLAYAQQRGSAHSVIDARPRGSYAIRGNLRYAQDEKPAEMIKIELRRFAGDMVGQLITRANGEFEFTGVSPGSYYLVVEETGFEPVREPVEVVSTSLFGVGVYLKKIGAAPGQSERGDSVSVRELSLPRDVRANFRKAMDVLYTKKDATASLPIFQQVTTAAPAFYEAFFHLGIAFNQLDRLTEAEEAFRKAVTTSEEKYPRALIALGSLLTTRESAAEAEPLVRHALSLDASLWQGHYELARALAALGKTADAEKSLAETVKLQPGYAPAYLLLANVHIRLKNHPALLADLNEFLKLEPNGPQSPQAKKMRDAVQQAMENAKNAPAAAPPKP